MLGVGVYLHVIYIQFTFLNGTSHPLSRSADPKRPREAPPGLPGEEPPKSCIPYFLPHRLVYLVYTPGSS